MKTLKNRYNENKNELEFFLENEDGTTISLPTLTEDEKIQLTSNAASTCIGNFYPPTYDDMIKDSTSETLTDIIDKHITEELMRLGLMNQNISVEDYINDEIPVHKEMKRDIKKYWFL